MSHIELNPELRFNLELNLKNDAQKQHTLKQSKVFNMPLTDILDHTQ